MTKGKLIVLEGCGDGIGKSTQLKLLKDRLISERAKIYSHHFPSYTTYQAEPIEHYLKGEYGATETLSPYFINTLYAVDRAITWNNTLKQEYEKGKLLLLDRYTTSSLIYQAAVIDDIEEKKRFIDYVIDYEYNKIGIKEPDITLFLTAPLDLLTELRKNRSTNDGISNDIHERNLEFMKRVYYNSMFIADYLGWDSIECSRNGEMRPREDINNDIYKLVKEMTKH